MNKQHWLYFGENGSRDYVGIFHEVEKGQVLIYCGDRPVLVDFKVFDTKTYTFFIEEELCILDILREPGGQFTYQFRVSEDADTPLNRQRKEKRRREVWQSAVTLAAAIFIVTVVLVGSLTLFRWKKERERVRDGTTTTGVVFVVTLEETYLMGYFYQTPQRAVRKELEYYRQANPLSENGLPVVSGDEFEVRYETQEVDNGKMDFFKPSPAQVQRYQERVAARLLQVQASTDTAYCLCLSKLAYQLEGIGGLAKVYHQAESRRRNRRHNAETYTAFVQSPAFAKGAAVCADEHQAKKER